MKMKRSMIEQAAVCKKVAILCGAVMLVAGLILTTAAATWADDSSGTKVIQIGTTAIANPTESGSNYSYTKIYYGTWSSSDEEDKSPVLWRVLGDWNGTTDRNSTPKLLLSEYVLATASSGYGTNNTWEGSYVQTWCQDFAGISGSDVTDAFSDKELAAIAATTKGEESTEGSYIHSGLSSEYVFLLSYKEVMSDTYFRSGTDRATTGTDTSTWWLRSGYRDEDGVDVAGVVGEYGSVYDTIVSYGYFGIRPAFNLDLSDVLFTSAATGGKISAAEDGATALNEISSDEVSAWKLTLKDSSRKFKVTESKVCGTADSTITLRYTGATEYTATSTRDYISVILMDADEKNALYYGRVSTLDAISGTVDIILPDNLTEASYVLYVFSEEYNEDTYTDYASGFSEVTLYVGAHNLTLHSSIAASCTTAGCEAYYLCANCGCMFADEDGMEEITEVEILPALGHTYDSNGVCTVCGASKASETTTASSDSGSTAVATTTSTTVTTTTSTVSAVADTATTTSASPKTSEMLLTWMIYMLCIGALGAALVAMRRYRAHD